MCRTGVTVCAALLAIVALTSCSSPSATNDPGTRLPPATAASSTAARIVSFTGPTAPPTCNAPTQVELRWTTNHAKTVTLRINGGPVFASYPNGRADELVPLTCDGNPQTYLLTARDASGRATTRSLVVRERELSAS